LYLLNYFKKDFTKAAANIPKFVEVLQCFTQTASLKFNTKNIPEQTLSHFVIHLYFFMS